MKEILLSSGDVALVDDNDYELISLYKWHVDKSHGNLYAFANIKRRYIFMHRLLMGFPEGMQIDHINHNGIDNRRCNLRVCTNSQNQHNRSKNSNNTSGFKGVYFDKTRGYYRVTIMIKNRHIKFGKFTNAEDAAHAYDEKAIELYGEFANLNFK